MLGKTDYSQTHSPQYGAWCSKCRTSVEEDAGFGCDFAHSLAELHRRLQGGTNFFFTDLHKDGKSLTLLVLYFQANNSIYRFLKEFIPFLSERSTFHDQLTAYDMDELPRFNRAPRE